MESSVRLNSGAEIPRVGLGVYQAARGEETQRAVGEALRAGYRHLDTAQAYGNEEDVGIAVQSSGIPRSELFITTKLWNDDQGYDEALRAFDASMVRLGLEYLDLYLLHWPVPGKRLDSWRALDRLVDEDRVRAVGVRRITDRRFKRPMTDRRIGTDRRPRPDRRRATDPAGSHLDHASRGARGPRAGEMGGGPWGSSRWSRMAATTGGSVRNARILIWPPQAGQSRGSTS